MKFKFLILFLILLLAFKAKSQNVKTELVSPNSTTTGNINLVKLNVSHDGTTALDVNITLKAVDNSSVIVNHSVNPNETITYDFNLTTPISSSNEFDLTIQTISTRKVSNFGPLPVTLTSFTGEYKTNKVRLNWSTATEKNTSRFLVQRSNNGVSFLNVDSLNAHGNSTTVKNYSFNDNNVTNNKQYYYRLKIVDYDKSFNYSNIITLNTNNKISNYLLDINNLTNFVTEINSDEIVQMIVITDMSGQIVYQKNIAAFSNSSEIKTNFRGLGIINIITNKTNYSNKLLF